MKYYLIVTIIIFLCSCRKSDITTNQTAILNHTWILSSIQNTRTNETIKYPDNILHKESITFADNLSTLSFGGVCNGGQGNFMLYNDKIVITDLITTQIYCQYYEWEKYLINNLDSISKFTVSNNQLTIYSKGSFNLIFYY